MIIYYYLLFISLKILCTDTVSIGSRNKKNDLVPYLSSRLDPYRKDSNSLKIVSNEPFIIQLQVPESDNGKDGKGKRTEKRKRPIKKRLLKGKSLRKKHRTRRDVIPDLQEPKSNQFDNLSKEEKENINSTLTEQRSLPTRQEIYTTLTGLLKKDVEPKKPTEENNTNIDDRKIANRLKPLLNRHHALDRKPIVKLSFPSTQKSELHRYKDVITDRERLEQKIKRVKNLLSVRETDKMDDGTRVRRRTESDKMANKIAKMFLTLSAVNGLYDKKKSKCREEEDDEPDIWEKERQSSPSRKSYSTNEQRYKIKKWIEQLKNKRSSRTCPCMADDDENDVFPLEQTAKGNYLLGNDRSSEESMEISRDKNSRYYTSKPTKSITIQIPKSSNAGNMLSLFEKRRRRKFELPLEDLEVYRSRAKQILRNAEEILDKIKEEEEKRLANPNLLMSHLKELTSKIQSDPRNNENDLIRALQKNLESRSQTPEGKFVDTLKTFILDPYEKAKALTDESTRQLSKYLLQNLAHLPEYWMEPQEVSETGEKTQEGHEVYNGQEPRKEDDVISSANLEKENYEMSSRYSQSASADISNTDSTKLEDPVKRRMEEMFKEQEETKKHEDLEQIKNTESAAQGETSIQSETMEADKEKSRGLNLEDATKELQDQSRGLNKKPLTKSEKSPLRGLKPLSKPEKNPFRGLGAKPLTKPEKDLPRGLSKQPLPKSEKNQSRSVYIRPLPKSDKDVTRGSSVKPLGKPDREPFRGLNLKPLTKPEKDLPRGLNIKPLAKPERGQYEGLNLKPLGKLEKGRGVKPLSKLEKNQPQGLNLKNLTKTGKGLLIKEKSERTNNDDSTGSEKTENEEGLKKVTAGAYYTASGQKISEMDSAGFEGRRMKDEEVEKTGGDLRQSESQNQKVSETVAVEPEELQFGKQGEGSTEITNTDESSSEDGGRNENDVTASKHLFYEGDEYEKDPLGELEKDLKLFSKQSTGYSKEDKSAMEETVAKNKDSHEGEIYSENQTNGKNNFQVGGDSIGSPIENVPETAEGSQEESKLLGLNQDVIQLPAERAEKKEQTIERLNEDIDSDGVDKFSEGRESEFPEAENLVTGGPSFGDIVKKENEGSELGDDFYGEENEKKPLGAANPLQGSTEEDSVNERSNEESGEARESNKVEDPHRVSSLDESADKLEDSYLKSDHFIQDEDAASSESGKSAEESTDQFDEFNLRATKEGSEKYNDGHSLNVADFTQRLDDGEDNTLNSAEMSNKQANDFTQNEALGVSESADQDDARLKSTNSVDELSKQSKSLTDNELSSEKTTDQDDVTLRARNSVEEKGEDFIEKTRESEEVVEENEDPTIRETNFVDSDTNEEFFAEENDGTAKSAEETDQNDDDFPLRATNPAEDSNKPEEFIEEVHNISGAAKSAENHDVNGKESNKQDEDLTKKTDDAKSFEEALDQDDDDPTLRATNSLEESDDKDQDFAEKTYEKPSSDLKSAEEGTDSANNMNRDATLRSENPTEDEDTVKNDEVNKFSEGFADQDENEIDALKASNPAEDNDLVEEESPNAPKSAEKDNDNETGDFTLRATNLEGGESLNEKAGEEFANAAEDIDQNEDLNKDDVIVKASNSAEAKDFTKKTEESWNDSKFAEEDPDRENDATLGATNSAEGFSEKTEEESLNVSKLSEASTEEDLTKDEATLRAINSSEGEEKTEQEADAALKATNLAEGMDLTKITHEESLNLPKSAEEHIEDNEDDADTLRETHTESDVSTENTNEESSNAAKNAEADTDHDDPTVKATNYADEPFTENTNEESANLSEEDDDIVEDPIRDDDAALRSTITFKESGKVKENLIENDNVAKSAEHITEQNDGDTLKAMSSGVEETNKESNVDRSEENLNEDGDDKLRATNSAQGLDKPDEVDAKTAEEVEDSSKGDDASLKSENPAVSQTDQDEDLDTNRDDSGKSLEDNEDDTVRATNSLDDDDKHSFEDSVEAKEDTLMRSFSSAEGLIKNNDESAVATDEPEGPVEQEVLAAAKPIAQRQLKETEELTQDDDTLKATYSENQSAEGLTQKEDGGNSFTAVGESQEEGTEDSETLSPSNPDVAGLDKQSEDYNPEETALKASEFSENQELEDGRDDELDPKNKSLEGTDDETPLISAEEPEESHEDFSYETPHLGGRTTHQTQDRMDATYDRSSLRKANPYAEFGVSEESLAAHETSAPENQPKFPESINSGLSGKQISYSNQPGEALQYLDPVVKQSKPNKLQIPKSIEKIMEDLDGTTKDDLSIQSLDSQKLDHFIDKIDEAERQNLEAEDMDCRKECSCAEEVNVRSRNIGRYEIVRDILHWMKDLQLNRVLSDD